MGDIEQSLPVKKDRPKITKTEIKQDRVKSRKGTHCQGMCFFAMCFFTRARRRSFVTQTLAQQDALVSRPFRNRKLENENAD
jgi:hypothetical protein